MLADQGALDHALDPRLQRVRITALPHSLQLVRVGGEAGHRRGVRKEPMGDRAKQATTNVPAPEGGLLAGRTHGLHVRGQRRDEEAGQPANAGERAADAHPIVESIPEEVDVAIPERGGGRIEPAPQDPAIDLRCGGVATDLEPAVASLRVEVPGGGDLEGDQVELSLIPVDGDDPAGAGRSQGQRRIPGGRHDEDTIARPNGQRGEVEPVVLPGPAEDEVRHGPGLALKKVRTIVERLPPGRRSIAGTGATVSRSPLAASSPSIDARMCASIAG